MISDDIEKKIKTILEKLGVENCEVNLENPVDLAMGDYSTNVAMVYAKNLKKNPKELAKKIVEKITEVAPPYGGATSVIKKVEVAGAGFINFYLSRKFFDENISNILEAGETYGSNESLKGKNILIEHSSPNLFKEFHIGHIVNNSLGESIVRIFKKSGAKVTAISYPSDVGLGVAKTLWAIKFKRVNNLGEDFLFSKESLEQKINFLGAAYVSGNKEYGEDDNIKNEIDVLNVKIYNEIDAELNKIYKQGKKITLEYFEKIIKRLESKFDGYFYESEAGKVGKKIIEENIGKVFEESRGAVIFKGENYGLHTRVFLNSKGLPVYEAKDLGLLKLKFDKYNPDRSIFLTDYEQKEYMRVVLKAAEQINSDWSKKTKHIVHGRLRFVEGRLSSRQGNVITANDLLDQIKEIVLEKMENNSLKNKDDVAEKISVGAVKYIVLKSSTGKNLIFNMKKSLSLEGDTGPYLQYTYARAKSVIEKAKSENISIWNSEFQENREISNVERLLYRFSEVVKRAGREYEPHYIATYLFKVAQAFNSYYGNNIIVNATDKNTPYKVALTMAVAQTIKNGLWLLGIEAPERL